MILTFEMAGEVMKFSIENKKIMILSKGSNYAWMPWNPVGLDAGQLSKLRRKYGETWYREYVEAESKFEHMDSDEEIADDLVKDMTKGGWTLVNEE